MTVQKYQLVMRSGPTPGKTFPLTKDEITIGRDSSNDIVINDAEVSRKHAQLVKQGGAYVIEDLGSTNGTFVNGQRLMGPHSLRPDELILLGENVSLVYQVEAYDPDATIVSGPGIPTGGAAAFEEPAEVPPPFYTPSEGVPEPAPEPEPEVAPVPEQEPEPEPVPEFTGQVPSGPVEPVEFEPSRPPTRKGGGRRTWLLAGCGCLILIACLLGAAAFAFDYLKLYCTPPFDAIFSFLYTCP